MTSDLSFIPEWNYDGFLPAFDPSEPVSRERSPYEIPLSDLVIQFGGTSARRKLLSDLLDFRAELHQAGLLKGFQWIDGSFAENVEERENRQPEDIDIVTFFHIPDGHSGETLLQDFPRLFDWGILKNQCSLDSYYVQLDDITSEEIIEESTYWYSLWSHTRDGKWKGYLQIDLADADDEQARLQLDQLGKEEGGSE